MKPVCLVTGATEGLGLELVKQYSRHGWEVIGLARNAGKLKSLKDEGLLRDFFICDLASETSVDEFISAFENRHEYLDKLILNAGIQNQNAILENTGYYTILRNEVQVNFLSSVKIVSALLPILVSSGSHIIAISSLLHLGPKPMAPGYCASKAALSNWVRNLRYQLRNSDIIVTEAIPGLIKTEMTREAGIKGINPGRLADIIYKHGKQETLVLPGARLAWFISRFWPGFIQQKMLSG